MHSLLVLGVTVLCLLLGATWLRYLRDPLRRFPGPVAAPFTRFYSVRALLTGREHEVLLDAHRKYGPVVRWQPNLLLLNDPKLLPLVYHHRSDKTPHYNASLESVESIVEAKSWHVHRNARRRISKPFVLESILRDEENINDNIASWLATLEKDIASQGIAGDFSRRPHMLGHDLNMIRLVGRPLSDVDPSSSLLNDLVDVAQDGAPALHTMARLPWLKDLLFNGPLARLLTPKSGDGSQLGRVLKFRDDLVAQERLQPNEFNKSRGRLMYHFVHEANNHDGTPMAQKEIDDDLTNFFFAGTETLAHTITAFILQMSRHPTCRQNLQDEIKTAVATSLADGSIKSPDAPLPYTTLSKLPYLDACIREILRLDPAVVSYLPRIVKTGGLNLPAGQGFIPAGTEVAMSPYVIGRSRELYGPDADTFRPERFLENPAWASEVLTYDFAWGYGNRRCLGKVLAMLFLRKTVFEFFRHFTPEVVSEGTAKAYLLWSHKDVLVRLERVG